MVKQNRTVEAARQKLLDELAKRDEWTVTRDSAIRDLDALQATAGDTVLDDPSAAESVPRRLQELRDRVETASRAIAAAEIRVDAAQARYLTAEADALEPGVVQAEEALERHQLRTQELLDELRKHEGVFVPEAPRTDLTGEDGALWKAGTAPTPVPRSAVLAGQVEALQRPIAILREMAAGRDPKPLVATWRMPVERAYPSCVWGPEAVVPAPAYLARLDAIRARRDQLASTLAEQLQALDNARRAVQNTRDEREKRPTRGTGKPTLADRVAGAENYVTQSQTALREAENELVQLTGKH